jgi:Zn finger protein HypA/HybF involved in hydrogenase expression
MSVINLDDKRPHLSGPAKCMSCNHEWQAVAPIGTEWLECPECHLEKGRLAYPVQRYGLEWKCHCGNDLFRMTPDGCYCPNCGEWQKGF